MPVNQIKAELARLPVSQQNKLAMYLRLARFRPFVGILLLSAAICGCTLKGAPAEATPNTTMSSTTKVGDILKRLFSPGVEDVSVINGKTPDVTAHLFTIEPAQRDKKSDFFLMIKVFANAKDASAELSFWVGAISMGTPYKTTQAGFDEAFKEDGIFLGRLGSCIMRISPSGPGVMPPAEFTAGASPLIEAFLRNSNADPSLLTGLPLAPLKLVPTPKA